jgi:N-acetylneuraminic acid mutarotase
MKSYLSAAGVATFLWLLSIPRAAGQIEPPSEPSLYRTGDFHLKTERFGAAAVAEGSFVYIVGGQNSGGFLGDIERFDVRTHEVTRLTNKLTPRHHHGAALVGRKIYVFGGRGYGLPHGNPYEPSMDIYDLDSGSITRGAPMRTPRAYFAWATVGGKIYAIGGSEWGARAFNQIGLNEVYDPETNTWSEAAPMPRARDTRAAAVVGDGIYVFGGNRRPDVAVGLKTVEGFVPGKNQWYGLPDLAERIAADSAAALGNCIYLFGNFDPGDKVTAYDLTTHASTVFKHGFLPASQSAAVTLGDSIYVIGGTRGGGAKLNGHYAMDDIQVFSLSAEGLADK